MVNLGRLLVLQDLKIVIFGIFNQTFDDYSLTRLFIHYLISVGIW